MTWRDGKVGFVPKKSIFFFFFHYKKCAEVGLFPLKKYRGVDCISKEELNFMGKRQIYTKYPILIWSVKGIMVILSPW